MKQIPSRIFAVGDMHGCHRKLAALLHRLPLNPETDWLVFLGDYINRGPDSRQVIELLLEVGRKVRRTVFLLGNNEYELLAYARIRDPEYLHALRPMGIEATLESYENLPMQAMGDLSFLPEEHKDFLEGLRPYYRLGDYLFIHAGIIPGEGIDESPLDRLLTVREPFLRFREPLGGIVVFGHTPFETPIVTRDKIGIDTGAAAAPTSPPCGHSPPYLFGTTEINFKFLYYRFYIRRHINRSEAELTTLPDIFLLGSVLVTICMTT